MTARCLSAEQAEAAAADLIFLPLETNWRCLPSSLPPANLGAEIPRGMFGNEEKIAGQLRIAAKAGVRWALCGNIGAVALTLAAGLQPFGGFGLNITNGEALELYQKLGLQSALLSMELTFHQMRFAQSAEIPVGLMVYGRQPLMLMRNCPRSAAVGCGNCNGSGRQGLVDRRGTMFPTACAGRMRGAAQFRPVVLGGPSWKNFLCWITGCCISPMNPPRRQQLLCRLIEMAENLWTALPEDSIAAAWNREMKKEK